MLANLVHLKRLLSQLAPKAMVYVSPFRIVLAMLLLPFTILLLLPCETELPQQRPNVTRCASCGNVPHRDDADVVTESVIALRGASQVSRSSPTLAVQFWLCQCVEECSTINANWESHNLCVLGPSYMQYSIAFE